MSYKVGPYMLALNSIPHYIFEPYTKHPFRVISQDLNFLCYVEVWYTASLRSEINPNIMCTTIDESEHCVSYGRGGFGNLSKLPSFNSPHHTTTSHHIYSSPSIPISASLNMSLIRCIGRPSARIQAREELALIAESECMTSPTYSPHVLVL
jgi:hypothetical protein